MFGKYGRALALPGLLAIPVDLLEGVVQVLALTDTADLVDAKAYLTPLKSTPFVAGFGVACVAWIQWVVAWVKQRHG